MSLLTFLPILIVFTGAFLLFKLDFFFIKHLIRTLKFAFSGTEKKKSVASLMLALAGTLGVGNISGVAIGIAIGGAGSVFWLIVSALFSASIKYAEVYLSYREGGRGMIDVIRGSFGNSGRFFAGVYASFALLLSFSMGSAFQARAIAESANNISGIKMTVLAPIITAFCIIIAYLGKERIKTAVAIIIPVASITYTGMCFCVVLDNFSTLPSVISKIFASAFSFGGVSGGILGFMVSSGMKEGFARGLLSNEAGAGTSSLSHTSHLDNSKGFNNEECERAGIFGILEVVFDTLVICPLTAIAILTGSRGQKFSGSLHELSVIFEKGISNHAPLILLICIVLFAASTTLCWYYYGRVALSYLSPVRKGGFYSFLFFACFFAALIYDLPYVLFTTDTALFILSVISTSAIMKKRALLRYDGKALFKSSD